MGFLRVASMWGSKQEPNLKVKAVTKNPDIQAQIDQAIGKSADTFRLTEEGLGDFMTRFAAAEPSQQRWYGEAQSKIGDIYSGALATQLAGLRENEAAARELGTRRAIDEITARDKAYSASLGLPGRSSYRDLNTSRLMQSAYTDAELAKAAQERADFNAVLAQQLGNLGTRQALADEFARREMIPAQTAGAVRAAPLATLGTLTSLDQANKYYALWRKKSSLERAADADDEFWNTIGQLASIAGSVYGMAGGGGAMGGGGGNVRPPPQQGNFNVGMSYSQPPAAAAWSPGSFSYNNPYPVAPPASTPWSPGMSLAPAPRY